MEKNTLRDLWLGNISEGEHMPISAEYRRADHLAERRRAELEKYVPKQQKDLLEAYTDIMYQLSAIFGEDAFVRGVSLGLRLACEALASDK